MMSCADLISQVETNAKMVQQQYQDRDLEWPLNCVKKTHLYSLLSAYLKSGL